MYKKYKVYLQVQGLQYIVFKPFCFCILTALDFTPAKSCAGTNVVSINITWVVIIKNLVPLKHKSISCRYS